MTILFQVNFVKLKYYNHNYFITLISSLEKKHNFEIQMDARTFGLPYDYASLMHYEPTAFSINGEPTIVPKKAGVEFLSNAKKLDDQIFTELDIKTVRILYSC